MKLANEIKQFIEKYNIIAELPQNPLRSDDKSIQNQPAVVPSRIMRRNIPSVAKSIEAEIAFFAGLHPRTSKNKSVLSVIRKSALYDQQHNIYRLILKLGMRHKQSIYPLISQLCILMQKKFNLKITGTLDVKSDNSVVLEYDNPQEFDDSINLNELNLFIEPFQIHQTELPSSIRLCFTEEVCKSMIKQAEVLPDLPKIPSELYDQFC